MPELALVMPFYRNGGMLRRDLDVWRHEWPEDLKAAVEIVLVDDGSPEGETAAEVLADDGGADLPALSLYRVIEDKPWHQHAARNLGAHVATAAFLLMTDMDHVLPADTMAEVLRRLPLGKREALTFGRVDAPPDKPWRSPNWREMARTVRDDGSLKPHVNSFCVARDLYWKIGGYEERYCGIYGCDQHWRTRLWRAAKETHLRDYPLIRVDRAVIPDASTRDVKRKDDTTRHAAKAAVDLQIRLSGDPGPRVLQFQWERVA